MLASVSRERLSFFSMLPTSSESAASHMVVRGCMLRRSREIAPLKPAPATLRANGDVSMTPLRICPSKERSLTSKELEPTKRLTRTSMSASAKSIPLGKIGMSSTEPEDAL